MPNRTPARLAAVTVGALAAGSLLVAPAEAGTVTAQARTMSTNEYAYRYFVRKGLTPNQSAAIVGNLMQESGTPINPKARQVGGPGVGIAQWSRGARWNALVKYAKKTKRSPYALNTQLDFIWVEFHGAEKLAFKKVRSSKTLSAATVSFSRYYERCAPAWCANGLRVRNAQKVLKSYR